MSIYIVGIGCGSRQGMTLEAVDALENCNIVVGYTTYIELVKPYFPDKEYLSTGMKREVDRCRLAIERATQGDNVALVCSGDSGIYGMASLVYQLLDEYPPVEVVVISGVTSAVSGGALMGSPLTNDFAVVSLSDLLTPKEVIAKRLEGATIGDFVICLYNPSSVKRSDYLQWACDIVLKYREPSTVCGYAQNIGRQGESYRILTLAELRESNVDMFTTVYIGNSQTKVIHGKMVTPRGYVINS